VPERQEQITTCGVFFCEQWLTIPNTVLLVIRLVIYLYVILLQQCVAPCGALIGEKTIIVHYCVLPVLVIFLFAMFCYFHFESFLKTNCFESDFFSTPPPFMEMSGYASIHTKVHAYIFLS
jgi:hypothetical protein